MQPHYTTTLSTVISQPTPFRHAYFLNIVPDSDAALVLQFICDYWWHNNRKPFIKFVTPCQHDRYLPGESWSEALGWGRDRFVKSRAKIATKNTTGSSRHLLEQWHTEAGELAPVDRLVMYWTNRHKETWYQLNETLLVAYLLKASTPSPSDLQIIRQLRN